jgi:hypothetical protein
MEKQKIHKIKKTLALLLVFLFVATVTAGAVSAKPTKPFALPTPSNMLTPGQTFTGTFNQYATSYTNLETYDMTLEIDTVNTHSKTFTGTVTYSSAQSQGDLEARVAGSYNPNSNPNTIQWKLTKVLLKTPVETPSIGETDTANMDTTAPDLIIGSGVYRGVTIGDFTLD